LDGNLVGIEDMGQTNMEHIFPLRIYYEDTDAGGVVHHGKYLGLFERARSELLLENGFDFYERHNRGEFLVVVEVNLKFRRPARLGDMVEVRTVCGGLGKARAKAHQKMYRGDELLVEAMITVAYLGGDGTPRRLPEDFVKVMKKYT
jgi:acyl-CoA thioester hydrolase